MGAARVLIADDDPRVLLTCQICLEQAGYEVETVDDGTKALKLLKANHYDVLLLALLIPGLDGLEVVSMGRELDPTLMIVMFTSHASLKTAVEAIKRGAFDYLAKPVGSDQLLLVVERALRHKRLVEESFNQSQPLATHLGFDRILGISEPMRKLYNTLQKIVRSNANILLVGETGTGKELVARTIHAHSLRRDHPFVAVDCAAMPDNLMESELFGHEKGAFTGADKLSRGLLELAHRGTAVFDEIGELSFSLQAKLLRTLQERELRRLGSGKTIPLDVRVIAATNRDLRAEIANRNFRADLYYRLNAVTVELPALRHRKDDILLLTNHFVNYFCRECNLKPPSLSPEVRRLFSQHSWPGNVRELQNVIQHAILIAQGDLVECHDLPDYLQAECPKDTSFHLLRERQAELNEKPFIEELLKRHGGNFSKVAAEAKMTRKTLYLLVRKFGINRNDYLQA
jgi:two-component system, NtrC family, response regulator HydG